MGVRSLFQWRASTYFLPKKTTTKRYYFSQKKSKNILFLAGLGRQGGGQADTHETSVFQPRFRKLYSGSREIATKIAFYNVEVPLPLIVNIQEVP